jgi:hypothetical protein
MIRERDWAASKRRMPCAARLSRLAKAVAWTEVLPALLHPDVKNRPFHGVDIRRRSDGVPSA